MTSARDVTTEKVLFDAADGLRGSVEPSEYKHLVLGLVFLKYISDSFHAQRAYLERQSHDPKSPFFTDDDNQRAGLLEDRVRYSGENVFWVPEASRWDAILAMRSRPDLGSCIDEALYSVEQDNQTLADVLPRIYADAELSADTLRRLVDEINKLDLGQNLIEMRDVLGRVYEYFLREFARSEGRRGGEFYTPASVVKLLVEILGPFEGRIYDPACGSCGMFVQSAEFIRAHVESATGLSIFGQEMNQATCRLGQMNLAIHGLSGEIKLGNSLLDDQHESLEADFILANPPFNQKKWGVSEVRTDDRWKWGTPPDGNANYAWIQHIASHLGPNGRAGFVLSNGSLTGRSAAEQHIRSRLLEDDLVDSIVALPGKLFYTAAIPVCLWFLDRNKKSSSRSGKVLFIDARSLGTRVSRTQVELTADDTERIAQAHLAWREDQGSLHVPGFAATVEVDEIMGGDLSLHPGRYVGAPEEEEEADYESRLLQTGEQLAQDLAENERLAGVVSEYLKEIGVVS